MEHETAQAHSGKTNKIMLPVSIIIAGIIIAGAVVYKPSDKPFVAPVGDARTASLSIDDDSILGSPTAPVTMIIFGDYQCPFCKQQADGVEMRLRNDYVKTGKVRMVFRDFPLENIHPYARPAAEAAQCAGEQGKYWDYHDALYAKQDSLSSVDFKQLAASFSLDVKKFSDCLVNPATKDEVTKDLNDGVALGIRGTPASFINNVYIEGAYPYDSFKQVIENEISKAGK